MIFLLQDVAPFLGSSEGGVPHVGRGVQFCSEGSRQRGNFYPGGLTRFLNFRRTQASVGHFIHQLCNHCRCSFVSRQARSSQDRQHMFRLRQVDVGHGDPPCSPPSKTHFII